MDIRHRLRPDELAEVTALLSEAEAADGHRPLADHKWLDLLHGGRQGFTALLQRSADGQLQGYGQLSAGHDASGLQTVVRPSARHLRQAVEPALVGAAVGEVAGRGGGRLYYWMNPPTDAQRRAAAAAGFTPGRELLQMAVPLPLDERVVRATAEVPVRAFRPGRDEEAWLAVNNRAFADHPEQGGWDLGTLAEREAEPWFDPEGFLVAEEGGVMVGSCWTKLHQGTAPLTGEIYVISVDPARHQRGLGRGLTVAGLRWLASRGAARGMLYVDGANAAAVHLYRSLGFTVSRVDQAYVLEVGAAR